jgi:hypothetical protein
MKKKSNFKPLPILMAAFTIVENFILNSAALILEQPQWADPYIANFKTEIEKFLSDYFGIKSKNHLKDITKLVNSIQKDAKENLSMVKSQITRNFKDNPDRKKSLLDLLGYTTHWKKANGSNQTELIALLFTFTNNLSVELRAELVGKNVNSARLTKIVALKQSLSEANITQETLKGSSKLETAQAIAALNVIYDQAMDVCVTGRRLFRKDPERRDMFTFSKIIRAQGVVPEIEKTENPETPTTKASKKKSE